MIYIQELVLQIIPLVYNIFSVHFTAVRYTARHISRPAHSHATSFPHLGFSTYFCYRRPTVRETSVVFGPLKRTAVEVIAS